MNSSPQNNPDAIRSDIDVTRRKMDDTMNALGDRLNPQHLLDEVLGFFRSDGGTGDNRLTQVREKITSSAGNAAQAIGETVKNNPVPALLIGAGLAWMIYEGRRAKSATGYAEYTRSYGGTGTGAAPRRDPDSYYDEPLEYPAGTDTEESAIEDGSSKLGQLKDSISEKAGEVTGQVKDKLATAGDAVRNKVGALRDRAGELGTSAKETTRELYSKTREQASTTVEHHPLEVGLAALAAGLVAGLILPTPDAVNRAVGPTADKLRARTQEAGAQMLEKGKRVAEAATGALQEEAEAQGLTPDKLKEKAAAVADRAKEATKDSAGREGLTSGPQM